MYKMNKLVQLEDDRTACYNISNQCCRSHQCDYM